ncbi:unnamed protein product [Rotaria magnacalcarata]|uniref:Uncharacterized protein n=1 Tax=Rotaria magnacalcarata TaxID=392030 RepID=A0A816YYH7_9BILA|nr:unnamed protein product [Rotaria magnacalcarata]CAF4185123.1 unnamed protein product [Rotaria magnacalcarata]
MYYVLDKKLDEQIRIALAFAKEQYQNGLDVRRKIRQTKRHQDEAKLLEQYQSPPAQYSKCEMKEKGQLQIPITASVTAEEYLKAGVKTLCHDMIASEVVSIEDADTLEYYLQGSKSDSDSNIFNDDEDDDFIDTQDSLPDPNEARLHYFTNISTNKYCHNLTRFLRNANICKSQSNQLISLIKSVLPEPNFMPSSLEELLTMMNIEDLFTSRKVCISCRRKFSCNENTCKKCQSTDQTTIATIFDIDLCKILSSLLQRLSIYIQEYKEKFLDTDNSAMINDIPFRMLYKQLVENYPDENLISLIFHLDGISLVKSTKLKLWLFSASIVELPPKLRHRRFNMPLMSIWIGHTEPLINLWLHEIVNKLNYLKSQSIHVSPNLNYKLKCFAVTGDCPAIRLILNFISHGGYWCCWLCYLKGVHVVNKRQYRCKLPIKYRHPEKYLQESVQATQENRDIFGHRGVSILHTILDTRLPECIIIDYLHCTLLGHAKTIIKDIYHQLNPDQRRLIDIKLKQQRFPHFFSRKIRPINDFAHVKATEIKNLLLYILLPVLQDYLMIEQLAHLALFICSIRLFHAESSYGRDVSTLANELFLHYYKDHDNYYVGLQNFVLHLHAHYLMIYKNFGSLCNIGCFGQEDLIGNISSNHHGTKFYGKLICHYYNIDFFLHSNDVHKLKDGPIDPTNQAPDATIYANECHIKLCSCDNLNKCIVIYRRCVIHEHMFHSLLYKKRQQSISYFVEYFDDNHMKQQHFGIIEYFFSLQDKSFALIQRYPVKHLYSNYFKTSTYYNLLKKALDLFFFVLQTKPSMYDIIPVENVSKHCIAIEDKSCLVVTSISSYNEHD